MEVWSIGGPSRILFCGVKRVGGVHQSTPWVCSDGKGDAYESGERRTHATHHIDGVVPTRATDPPS